MLIVVVKTITYPEWHLYCLFYCYQY